MPTPLPLQKLTKEDRVSFSSPSADLLQAATDLNRSLSLTNNGLMLLSKTILLNTKTVFESNKLMKESLDMSKEAAKAVKSFDTGGGESFEQGIIVDTEMKPSWLDSIKDSLSNIMNFTKPDDKSDEATKKKEALKAKKIAEREARWQEKTRKWRSDLKDSLVKGATDNPIVNFLKDHWKLLLVGLSLFFLKPEQMKKAWDSLVKGMMWLIKEGPGILQGIWDTLDKWVPKVFDGIVTVSGWIKSLIDAVIGRKVTDEDVKEAEDRQKELREKAATPGGLSGEEKAELGELDEKLAAGSQFRKDHAGFKKTGKRQGGLLGEGGSMWEKAKGIGAAVVLFVGALALLTKSFVPIMAALKLFGGGLRLGGRGLRSFGRQANRIGVPKKGGFIANQRRNIEAKRLREQRANRTLKPKPTKPLLGSPKPTGAPTAPKVDINKALGGPSTPRALPPKTPSITAKPSTGGMSTTATGASKMGKWASKFPKLAKGMKFLTKIPGPVGKAFMVGPLVAALAGGADKKTILPMIGGMLGGIGGGALGALLGGMIGAVGGPVALITGALGGIMGGMLGDSLGMGIAQWLVGDTVDALPFDWMNDVLNGGKGPEGGDLKQTPKAAAGEAAPPADSPSGGATKIPKGGKSAAPQFKIDTFMLDDDSDPNTLKAAKAAEDMVNKTRQKVAKIEPANKGKRAAKTAEKAKKKVWGKLGRAMRTMPMDVRMLVHEGLTDKELKMMDYGAWDDKRKSTMTDEEIAADEAQTAADLKKVSGISGGDDFAGAVTPTEKIAGQRALDAESAKLSGSSNVVAPITNNNITNNYGGGGKDTAIVTEKSASNSKLVSYLDEF